MRYTMDRNGRKLELFEPGEFPDVWDEQRRLHSSQVPRGEDGMLARRWVFVAAYDLHVLHGMDAEAAWEHARSLLPNPYWLALNQREYMVDTIESKAGWLRKRADEQVRARKMRDEAIAP